MRPLITIFGNSIPTSDFWAGIIVFVTIAGICTASAIARHQGRAVDFITTLVWSGVAISAVALGITVIF